MVAAFRTERRLRSIEDFDAVAFNTVSIAMSSSIW